jgi:hypothetical protein
VTSIDASKEAGVKVKAEKIKNVAVSSPDYRGKSRSKFRKQIVLK